MRLSLAAASAANLLKSVNDNRSMARRDSSARLYNPAEVRRRPDVRRNAMPSTRRLPVVLLVVLAAASAAAQTTLPNPYRLADHWAQLPAGMQWAGVISVDPDAKGNLWVFHRSDPTILKFDRSGKLVASFGTGMFVQAHGMTIDPAGN